jgi:hypothetical protein
MKLWKFGVIFVDEIGDVSVITLLVMVTTLSDVTSNDHINDIFDDNVTTNDDAKLKATSKIKKHV